MGKDPGQFSFFQADSSISRQVYPMAKTVNPLPLRMTSIAEIVKRETAEEHQAAEDMLNPKLQGIAKTADYIAILSSFYGFYRPLQEKISGFIREQDLADIHERNSSRLIEKDLTELGFPLENIKISIDLPRINSAASAFGALYVMEGSTLGGRMIRKMLLKNEQLNLSEKTVQFFNGYGNETGTRWRNFQEALNNQSDTNEVVFSARQTFNLFRHWINQSL